jgi:hypothetical protein
MGYLAEGYETPGRARRSISQIRREAGDLGITAYVLAERQVGIGVAQTRKFSRSVLPDADEAPTPSLHVSYWLGGEAANDQRIHESVVDFLAPKTALTTEIWTMLSDAGDSLTIEGQQRSDEMIELQRAALEAAGFTNEGFAEDHALHEINSLYGTLYVRRAVPEAI